MFRNSSISIKYPLIVSVIGLCLIAVSMLSAHMILQKRLSGFREELSLSEAESQDRQFDNMSRKITTLLSFNLAHHLYHHDIKEMNSFIDMVKAELPVVSIKIADTHGRVLADGNTDPGPRGLELDISALKSASSVLTRTEDGRKVMFSIPGGGRVLGYGEAVFSSDIIRDRLRARDMLLDHLLDRFEITVKRAGLTLTLAVIAITVLLSIIFGRKISSPLMTIADATKKISDGDLSVVVPVQSGDEIGALAERFNAMVEKLKIAYADMKFTEDMLRDSVARHLALSQEFNVILDAIPDNLTLISPDLKTVWVNRTAAQSLGKESREAIGNYCYELWYGRKTPCEGCYALECLKSGTVVEASMTNAGSILDVKAFPIKDDGGAIINVLAIGRDITEKIRIEDTARRTYHLAQLGRLSAGMGHEINNPNNFILSNAQLLQDIWYDAARILRRYYEENGDFKMGGLLFSEMDRNVSQILYRIIEGSQRIKNIVAGLRSYSVNKGSGHNEEIDINRVINYALLIIGHQIRKFTDSFEIDLGAQIPPVRGESSALEQMVINIVMNALQALPDKSCRAGISSSYDDKGDQVVIVVRDEGIGMPTETLARVFDPFFTTKHDKGGTGLGLSISHSIIKKSSGSIEFKSESGKGTIVTIKLPAAYNQKI